MKHLGHAIAADKVYGGRSELRLADVAAGLPAGRTNRNPLPGGAGSSGVAGTSGGSGDRVLIARQALHARRIVFRHPVSGERLEFEAEVPSDMQQTLAALRAGG
jgi:23S rRNA pseudouridine1911/1915/1917 synthase